MGTRHSYVPSKDAAVHTRRALRMALAGLREESIEALAIAQRVLDRANAAIHKLDADSPAGELPTPIDPSTEFGRVVRWSARVDALLMAAYSAETGDHETT